MKKLVGLLVVLAMLMAFATAAFAEGDAVGSVSNPAELVLGENVAEVAANPEQLGEKGYYFAWTASEEGVLTIDFSDEDTNRPYVTFYVFDTDGLFAGYAELTEQGGSVDIPVSAGYLVQFGVEEYDYQAATFHFTATFVASGAAGAAGTEADPWIIETLPTVLEGTISEADAADEEWPGYYYQFTAAESGTITWTPWTGCGLFVTINDEWVDGDSATVAAGDVVMINVWALFGASDYTVTVAFEGAALETVEHTFDSLVDVNIGSIEDKAEIPEGTTFADGFFTVVGKLTQRYQESKGGIYAVEIAKNGTGAIQFTTTGTADVTFVVSSTGGSNTSTVALINLNTLEVMANVEGLSEVSTTAATTLTYEDLPAGTYQLVSPESDYNRGFRLMTISVVETQSAPSCTHDGTIYLEQDFCYGDEVTYDLVETCWECGATFERYAPGTEKNPILVDFQFNDEGTVGTATVTVPAGQTVYFGQYRIGGRLLTVNGVEYGILEDMGWFDPTIFALSNEGAEDATYELMISYPLGHEMNPIILTELGTLEIVLAENNDGVYYKWVATEEGLLTLTVEGNNWFYVMNNNGDPENWSDDTYGEMRYAMYGDSNTDSVSVKIGDEIIIGFATMTEDWIACAETLTVTLSLGEPPVVEAKPAVLGDNDVADGKYEFVATEDGTLYFCVTGLSYKYGDISDQISAYVGSDVELYVNGELVADGYFGFLDVVAGDVVTFEWLSAGYYTFDGVLNLSYENNNPALGSYQRPVHLEYADCPTNTIEIAPGTTVWYELTYDFYDAVVTVKGENAYIVVTYRDWMTWQDVEERIDAVDGVATLTTVKSIMIQIGNAGTEPAVFEIDAYIPEGSSGNPADLEIGENVVDLEENRPDYYYYEWTAPSDGVLTVQVSGDFWHFYMMNRTSYESSDWLFYYGDLETGEVVDTATLGVSAGDQIIVAVSTCINWYDPNWDGDQTLPAGTITTMVSFTCAHSNLVHVDAVEPGCYTEGNIEHWYCEDCETVWADGALTQITNHLSVKLPATHQHIVHVDAVEPGCFSEGNMEYWYCEDCVTVWVDENLMQISNMMSVKLPATHQHVVHVEAKAPTCTENGNIEYWYCEDCVTVWVDEYLMQISNMMSIVDPATGHNYVDGVCTNCGENDQNVPDTGDMIAVAVALLAVSGVAVIALPKKKEN